MKDFLYDIELLEGEEFRDVPGLEEYYMVSNMGRVLSKPRYIFRAYTDRAENGFYRKALIQSGAVDACGYKHVRLSLPNTYAKVTKVHNLVYSVFHPEYNDIIDRRKHLIHHLNRHQNR